MTALSPRTALEFTKKLLPGLLVTALVAMAAAFPGNHYKGSVLLFALLPGLALHFVSDDKRCAAGIRFASSTMLRLGVALLGLRLARLFKVQGSLGLLIGGATAICDASAALAGL